MADEEIYWHNARYTWEIKYMDKRQLFEATKRDGEIDTAVPQPWFDANYEEIQAKHGACWWYHRNAEGQMCEEPLFVTDMLNDIGIELTVEFGKVDKE